MTKRSLRGWAAALAVVLLAGPLAAQQTPEARVEAAMDRARSADLPVQILESKLAEGRAKNVAMERIAMVIERRVQAMERANAVLSQAQRERPTPQELAVATDAIEVGVSEAILGEIARSAGAERRTVAIAALAYLVAEGHLPEVARQRVQQALARGGEGLSNLPGMAGSKGQGVGPPPGVPAGPPEGVGKPTGPPGERGKGRPGGD
jgi:hypothetical protein